MDWRVPKTTDCWRKLQFIDEALEHTALIDSGRYRGLTGQRKFWEEQLRLAQMREGYPQEGSMATNESDARPA